MVVGASKENDLEIMSIADNLYKRYQLKRVYYSGYVPISNDNRLPVLGTPVPVIRENRLYQADWLTRFYQFSVKELVDPRRPNLDLDIDPKLSWALRNLDRFPVDINTADYEMILRIPGIGIQSAKKIVSTRRFRKLGWEELRKLGVASGRAKHFAICNASTAHKDVDEQKLRQQIIRQSKFGSSFTTQTALFT